MATKHTPGPWFVVPDERPGMQWNVHIHSDQNTAVCFMAHSDGRNPKRDAANARLIAAAPLMVDALRYIVERENFAFAECSEAEEIWSRARAALAAAVDTPQGGQHG